jgi:hypothetical protein
MATKSAGSDAVGQEIDDIIAKNNEQDDRLDDIEARLDALETGGGTPPDPGGGEGEIDPPPVTGGGGGTGAPSGWSDPRFTGMTERTQPMMINGGQTIQKISIDCRNSGDAAFNSNGNYSAKLIRARCREGIRISARGIYLIEDAFIEYAGSGDDHGDGVQFYGPGNAPEATFRRLTVVVKPGSNNCSFFAADHADAKITLEDFYLDGTDTPHGAFWLPANDPDFGCLWLSAKNGVLKGYKGAGVFDPNKGLSKVTVAKWENIKDDRGNPIPNPKG